MLVFAEPLPMSVRDLEMLTWVYARTDDWTLPNLSSPAVTGGGGTWSSVAVNYEEDWTPGDDISGSLLSAVSDGGTGGTVSWTATASTPGGMDDLRGVAGGLLLQAPAASVPAGDWLAAIAARGTEAATADGSATEMNS